MPYHCLLMIWKIWWLCHHAFTLGKTEDTQKKSRHLVAAFFVKYCG